MSEVGFGNLNFQSGESALKLQLRENSVSVLVELSKELFNVYTALRDLVFKLLLQSNQLILPSFLLFLSNLLQKGVPG